MYGNTPQNADYVFTIWQMNVTFGSIRGWGCWRIVLWEIKFSSLAVIMLHNFYKRILFNNDTLNIYIIISSDGIKNIAKQFVYVGEY